MSETKRPHFFKVLLGDFSQRLRIPPAFVKHIVRDASQRAIIKGPNGGIWNVKLSKSVNTSTYLDDGWQKFIEDYSLEESDFLVFRYDGNMQFTVQIFDKTACEKEYVISCDTDTDQGFTLGRGIKKGSRPKKISSDFRRLSQLKSYGSVTQKLQIDDHAAQTSQCKGQSMAAPKINRFKKIKVDDVDLPKSNQLLYGSWPHLGKAPINNGSEKEAFEKANSFAEASKFPHFLQFMRKFCVNKPFMMTIPTCFSMEHLPKQSTMICLRNPKGGVWEVSFLHHQYRKCLCGGWGAFARANNLEIGDICVFELVDRCQMQVHIFPLKTPRRQSKRLKELSH